MAYILKPVRCDNCKFWKRHKEYNSYGTCSKDGNHSREFHACNKLPTNEDRRNAKINRFK